ncbi:hypothetical protein CEQ90_08525 [Lewinellaceae bacterium SD302]|nr:hypothetical protein CEQ90_08525 [Lewinellaceae bacterium SD302]
MQKLLLFLCLLCYFEATLIAQVVRTHTDGSKIIVYPDGSAVYFNDKKPVPDYQQGDYPILAVKIEPLSSAVNVTETDLKQIADRKLQLAREAATLATERAAAARENRQRLEQRLVNAKSGIGSQNAGNLQRQVHLARRIETESLEESRKANVQMQQAENVIRQNRYVEAYNESRRQRRASSVRGAERRESLPQARRLFSAYNASFTGYGAPVTQGKQLPSSPCTLAHEGKDPKTGQYIRASKSELFFTHTDESLRPYLEGKEYLTAEAFVHSRAGYRYLTIKLTFANPNAMQTYGYLPEGSILSMHLLDGNFLNLRSAQDANGSWDDSKKELSYTVTYPIDRSMIGTLRQSELNYVQLFWSSGFEEYDIYQVDVLQRLFDCL